RGEWELAGFDETADVVVVGLGAAGTAAALEARAAGASVLALERASAGGGTSALSGGVLYLGGGTALQRACGFEDDAESMFRYLQASCGDAPDEAKLRAYCEHSVAHYDWIVARGVPFKPVFHPGYSGEPPNDDGLVFSGSENAWPFREIARPAPRGHVPATDGAAGHLLMRHLLARVAESGAQQRGDHRVTDLVVDRDGAVVGCVAAHHGGERALRARGGVVLTTGGFINSKEMMQTYLPRLRRCKYRVGAEGDDGSGIRLGMAAGGAVLHMEAGSVSLPVTQPWSLKRGVLVNGQGQRFVNEDAYYGRLGEFALLHHDGVAFLVLDDATFERPAYPREVAAVGETPAELERELALPPASLEATRAHYNPHPREGRDPVFHKAGEYLTPLETPPFGALDCRAESSLYAAFTLGGLATSVEGEVLDPDGRPVPGLLAAGRSACGLSVGGYSSGLSLGDGTFFGRRAGRRAARGAA
ncbi:MAG: FAD-dependent oxidoreductase, partial [Myxococcota bacterium]|nr:FAD-dependent oxidoreductase [Myxococcota bacterium]